jgi:hypothetical protein
MGENSMVHHLGVVILDSGAAICQE